MSTTRAHRSAPGGRRSHGQAGRDHRARRIPVMFFQSQQFFGSDSLMHSLLMRNLPAEGFEVHVAYPVKPGGGRNVVREQLAKIPGLRLVPVNFGPSVFRLAPPQIARGVWQGIPAVLDLPRLALYMRRHNIRVVHGTEKPRDALYGVLLARAAGARSVVHLHVKLHEELTGRALWALEHADAVVGVSPFVADSAAAAGISRDRLHYVLNALDLTGWDANPGAGARIREEFHIPEGAPVLTISARLFSWKGHRELIEAVGRVAPNHPDVRLLIVGEDDPRAHPGGGRFSDELRALAASRGVGQNVIFTGFRSDVRDILAAADIYTMPTFEEPCAVAFLEAMAMAKPVVALASGGTPEMVQHGITGLLSAPGDLDVLAENLETLLSHPELRTRMGTSGRRRVETHFTPQRMAADMARVYRSLLAMPAPDAEVASATA